MAPKGDFDFRGQGSVLRPNHITRYIYPSLLGYSKNQLLLQNPRSCATRIRPQGRGSWDNTFLTITQAGLNRHPPTRAEFKSWFTSEHVHDHASNNPIGRAMKRVVGFPGNTTLEAGKFKFDGKMVYVIKRTTRLPLGGADAGQFRQDEDTYVAPCGDWRDLMPKGGHDSWWTRLHDLFNSTTDRAFFNVRDRLDELGISMALPQWLPRPDVEKAVVKIEHRKTDIVHGKTKEPVDSCIACSGYFYQDSDHPCMLKCGDWFCIECVTVMVDGARKININAAQEDYGTKFAWRCPLCSEINPAPFNRHATISADELPYWRWRTADAKLQDEASVHWPTRLDTSMEQEYIPWYQVRDLAPGDRLNIAFTWVRLDDARPFMRDVAIWVASLQPYGFSADNPTLTDEAKALHKCLDNELVRLSKSKQQFNTPQLIDHMKTVGAQAFTPVVVEDKEARLKNPILPVGYEKYREFLCEWTARGCFLSTGAKLEIMEFVQKMKSDTGPWWKDSRDYPPPM